MHDDKKEQLKQELHQLYPDFPSSVTCDLHHLLVGNAKHIETVKQAREGSAYDHEERVIGIGTGFDWLHKTNYALIVNPNDIDLETPIVTSGIVLLANLEKKRISADEGVVVMISTSYREIGDRHHAQLKARDLAELAYKKLSERVEGLFKYDIKFLIGTMSQETRLFELLAQCDGPEFLQPKNIPSDILGTNKTVEYLLIHNKAQSKEFMNPYQKDLRTIYRRDHPTEILALKCMDGRMNLPVITGAPMGVINPARNLGSKFSPGWKGFYDDLKLWKIYAIKERKNCLVLATYHYSQHDLDNPDAEHKFGCAGHGYNTANAKEYALNLAEELRYVMGEGKNALISVAVIGVNTDNDSIIVHGQKGEQLKVVDYLPVEIESEVCV